MGSDSDRYAEQELLTTVVTCEGDLSDPKFNTRFNNLLENLKKLLLLKDSRQQLGVVKIEPWNSVRVTFTIPREAALRLRQLAHQGDATLSQLGILSVQLEGDQAISLRIAGQVSGESQEIVLKTVAAVGDSSDFSSSTLGADNNLISGSVAAESAPSNNNDCENSFVQAVAQALSAEVSNSSSSNQSLPNSAPPFGKTDTYNTSFHNSSLNAATKTPTMPATNFSHPYQSCTVQQQQPLLNHATTSAFTVPTLLPPPPPPPPPYTTSSQVHCNKNRSFSLEHTSSSSTSPANVALSSPLLVNLLQNQNQIVIENVPATTAVVNTKLFANTTDKFKLPDKSLYPSSTVKRKVSSTTIPEGSILGAFHQSNAMFVNETTTDVQTLALQDFPATVTNSQLPSQAVVSTVSPTLLNNSHLPHSNIVAKHPTPVVNMFQRSASVPSSSMSIQQRSYPSPNPRIVRRVSANDSHTALTEQAQKLGIRLINIQQQQLQQQNKRQLLLQQKHQELQQQQQYEQRLYIQQQQAQKFNKYTIQQPSEESNFNIGIKDTDDFFASLSSETSMLQPGSSHQQGPDAIFGPNFMDIESISSNIPHTPSSGSCVTGTTSYNDERSMSTSQSIFQLNTVTAPSVDNTVYEEYFADPNSVSPYFNNAPPSFCNPENKFSQQPDASSCSVYNDSAFQDKNAVAATNTTGRVAQRASSFTKGQQTVVRKPRGTKKQEEMPQNTVAAPPAQLPKSPEKSSEQISSGAGSRDKKDSSLSEAAASVKEKQFLINPLTGELEPMPSESSSDSESEKHADIFGSLQAQSDQFFNFSPPTTNERSNSFYSDEDDDSSSTMSRRNDTTDHSDSEASSKSSIVDSMAIMRTARVKHNSSVQSAPLVSSQFTNTGEKIKLRLKLEKNEPVVNAYKVDVSFGAASKPPSDKLIPKSTSCSSPVLPPENSSSSEELRVPPLHISLKGRNAAVVKKDKKSMSDTKEQNEEEKKIFVKAKFGKDNNQIQETESEESKSSRIEKQTGTECVGPEQSSVEERTDPDDTLTAEIARLDEPQSFEPVLTPVRTFPTEAEITSILRSVPSDVPNKMSLSCVKMKKKDVKKKLGFSRDGSLSGSSGGDEAVDSFTRVINDTKASLSQIRTKQKSSVSLLKSVMKSSAAKEARMMGLANKHFEKRHSAGNVGQANNDATAITFSKTPSNVNMQRRQSIDVSAVGMSQNVSVDLKVNSRTTSDASISTHLSFFASAPMPSISSSLPSSASFAPSYNNVIYGKDTKKFANNILTNRKNAVYNRREFHGVKSEKEAEVYTNECVINKNAINFLRKPNIVDTQISFFNQCNTNQVIPKMNTMVVNQLELTETKQELEGAFRTKLLSQLDSSEILKHESLTMKLTENILVGGDSPTGVVSEHVSNQGEDSGIESMDTLSEKSPNQGESPCRKDEAGNSSRSEKPNVIAYCDKNPESCDIMGNECQTYGSNVSRSLDASNCTEEKHSIFNDALGIDRAEPCAYNDEENETRLYNREIGSLSSPDEVDDLQPFRLTPALYTYSNPEKIRAESPSPTPLEDITEDFSSVVPRKEQQKQTGRMKRKRKDTTGAPSNKISKLESNVANEDTSASNSGKSLLEQLLVEVPPENVEAKRTGVSTRNTRSQLKGLSDQGAAVKPSNADQSVSSRSSRSNRKLEEKPVLRVATSRTNSRRNKKNVDVATGSSEDHKPLRLSKRKYAEEINTTNATEFEDNNNKKTATSATIQNPVVGFENGVPIAEVSSNVTSKNVNKTESVVGTSTADPPTIVNTEHNQTTITETAKPNTARGKRRRGSGESRGRPRRKNSKLDAVANTNATNATEPNAEATQNPLPSVVPNRRGSGRGRQAVARRSLRHNYAARHNPFSNLHGHPATFYSNSDNVNENGSNTNAVEDHTGFSSKFNHSGPDVMNDQAESTSTSKETEKKTVEAMENEKNAYIANDSGMQGAHVEGASTLNSVINSEEMVNTRRKTRSSTTSLDADLSLSSATKRRRNSRDAKS